jgi:molybdopterin/thiamine biosynthesis adenylyltransferase
MGKRLAKHLVNKADSAMNDVQLSRYSRHISLPQVNRVGQQKLIQSRVMIVGLGGLGSPVAMYLASAGIGELVLADFDQVDLSNLQRQIVHNTDQIGQNKVISAQSQLQSLNPEIQITTYAYRLDPETLQQLITTIDIVVDCSDNFATRFAINAACVRHGTPLISAAVQRWSGQVTVFLPAYAQSPCYACLYPNLAEEGEACSETGVLAPVAGIIGSIQAVEVIKVLLGINESLCGKLLILDAYTLQWRTLKLLKDPACLVCSSANFRKEIR